MIHQWSSDTRWRKEKEKCQFRFCLLLLLWALLWRYYLSGDTYRSGEILQRRPASLRPDNGAHPRLWWRYHYGKTKTNSELSQNILYFLFKTETKLWVFKVKHLCHHLSVLNWGILKQTPPINVIKLSFNPVIAEIIFLYNILSLKKSVVVTSH